MKYTVRSLVFMVGAFLATFSPNANAQPKFRVAWQNTITGVTGHGQWISENNAFYAARDAGAKFPELRRWVEKKRVFLFIPLPSRRIAPTSAFASTAGMKTGDAVRYHLPEWKIDKSKKGSIEGIDGDWVLFVDGKAMGVSCITEHYAK